MQYPDDAELAAALAATTRNIQPRVEFDWSRDGSWSGPYADLSLLCQNVTSEAQLQGNLPDAVNTITGFSSREMNATLAGHRTPDEFDALHLFSPYEPDSPLYGYEVIGTPVRYSRVVELPTGSRAVRQFTGWVRSVRLDHASGEVHLVASDIIDFASLPVTLPLWAINGSNNDWFGSTIPAATTVPIESTWVVEEIMRQLGRSSGPLAPPDTVAYISCNGSFIPSVGTFADGWAVQTYMHHITASTADPWKDGRYGLAPKTNTSGSSRANRNGSLFVTESEVVVPNGGSADAPVTLSAGLWVEADGTSGAYGSATFTHSFFAIDAFAGADGADTAYTLPGCAITAYPDGSVRLTVGESTGISGPKTWIWGRQTALTAGWHYVAAEFRFQNSAVTAVLRVDDATVSFTTTSLATGGYRYLTYPHNAERNNLVQLIANVPCQHLAWWRTYSTTGIYTPGQGNAPTTTDGAPLSIVERGVGKLAYIPDIVNQDGWSLLQKIVGADFSTIRTDEFGTVVVARHITWTSQTVDPATVVTLDDDALLGFTVYPSLDGYRNEIATRYFTRRATKQIVYSIPEPWYLGNNSTGSPSGATDARDYFADNTISVRATGVPAHTSVTKPTASPNPYTGLSMAVKAQGTPGNYTQPTTDIWAVTARFRAWQRTFQLAVANYDTMSGIYFAWSPGTEGAIHVAGIRYTDDEGTSFTVTDPAVTAGTEPRRSLVLDDNEWRQTYASTYPLLTYLLADVTEPTPVVENVSIRSDARLQQLDVVRIASDRGVTGSLYAQVTGISREDSTEGSRDALTLRVLLTPGEWILDDAELSILDETTILS